jgi:hypothetical protein
MNRRLVLPACAAAGAAALIAANPATAGSATNRFTPGLHLSADFPYGLVQAEPSVQVMPDTGAIFVAAPASTPIGCEVWKLTPDARSFSFRGAPDSGVGGGDCDLSAVPNGTGEPTIAYSSLTLPNLTVGNSADGGQTWTTPNPVASQIVGTDRQWMTTATDGTVYMSYHIVATNNIAVAASTDGGLTYLDRGLAIDPAHIAQALYNNELGPIVEDPTSSLSPKPLYTIFTAPKTALENANSFAGTLQTANDGVYLAASYDGAHTWVDTPIYEGDGSETYDHIFPALSVDKEGGLWAAWSSEKSIYASYRAPGSLTWTSPIQANSTGVANIYPWIVGGKGGRADVVWYGGTGANIADATNQWNVFMAQLQVNHFGPATKSLTVASDHVIHYGQICTTGVTCPGTSRALLDFFQIDLTRDGRAVIAWADDSLDTSGSGAAQIYVTEQCAGVSATTGKALTDAC